MGRVILQLLQHDYGSLDGDMFGTIVAGMDPLVGTSSADVNGDGIADGDFATQADINGNKSGSVYIFHGGFTGDLNAARRRMPSYWVKPPIRRVLIWFCRCQWRGNTDLLVGIQQHVSQFWRCHHYSRSDDVELGYTTTAVFYGTTLLIMRG